MKKLIAWLLLLTLTVGLFAGCKPAVADPTEPDTTVSQADIEGINAAIDYLKTFYKDDGSDTPVDYERFGIVRIGGVPYTVVWTVDVSEDLIKIVVNDDGTVTIDVNENCEEDTPYVLTATITDAEGNSVSHSWKHILPKAVDMVSIVKAAYALAPGESLPYESTLRGKITQVKTPYSEEYKNITVVIEVEGAEDMPIECYRLKGEGAEELAVGDIITVTGTLKNYNGTIEFDAGCVLIAVVPGERVEAPDDMKQIVDEAYALGANKTLPYEATLTGTITAVKTPYDEFYGNITVEMVVEGREDKPIVVYRLKGDGVDKIGVNDVITVKGYITNYVGTAGYSTIEFTAGCQLLSWEDHAAPVAPSDPKQIVDEAYALGANKSLKYEATLTGKITKVKTAYDPSYGNITVEMVIEGRENKPIVAYRMKGSGVENLDIGDIITVKGYIKNYVGDAGYSTIEFDYPTLVSYTKNANKAPSDPKQIVKDAYALKPGAQLPYKATLTGVITKVNTAYDASYKNVTVTIVVAGAEDMPIKCFRLKGTGAEQIGEGDTITVSGYIVNFQHSSGDTEVEFEAGCRLESWKDTGAGGNEPTVPPTTMAPTDISLENGDKVVIFAPAYNKALSADKVDETSYYNKGVDVTVSGGVVSGYTDKEVWTVTLNSDGTYTFANGGKTIGLEDEFSSMNLGAKHDDWIVIPLGDGLYLIRNVARSNYIEWYASKNNWSTFNSNRAATDDQFQLSLYVVGKGLLDDEAVELPEPETTVPPTTEPPTTNADGMLEVIEMVKNPVVGTPYKLYSVQANVAKTLFITGETANTEYYLATTEDMYAGIDVYLEAAQGGYYLYFMNGTTKTYIDLYLSNTGYQNIRLVSEPSVVYTYNTEYNTLVAPVNGEDCYIGTYKTYETFSCSKLSFASTSFPSHLGVIVEKLPSETEPPMTVPPTTEPPETEPQPTTEPADISLETGDKVVIFVPAYNKALSADKVTETSFYNKGVDVTVSGGVVSGYGNAEIWTATKNADGSYSFANGGKNIGLEDKYSSMNLGAVNDDWYVVSLGDGLYNIRNVVRGNYIEWYAEMNNWSSYDSKYAATDDQFQMSLYVIGKGLLEDEAVELPEPETTEPQPTTEPTPAPEIPETGDSFVIYNAKDSKVVTTTNKPYNSKDQLATAEAILSGGKVFTSAEDVLVVTMVNNDDNTVSFKTADGKYLHADGTHVNLSDSENDNTKFVLEETSGGYFIKLANATYNGKAQYLEYYAGSLTSYGMNANNTAIYVFAFYPLADGDDVPETTEPEVEETTEPEVEETTAPETPDTAEYVVIYSVSGGKVATTTNQPYNNKDQLVMADATLADGKVTTDAADVLLVTIVNNADNTVSFKTADGKYLHADATNVNLVNSENDDTKFVLEETDGGYFIKLANATFSGKAQYLEYYYEKLTCYGMSTSNPAIYVFQFYPMAETEEEETTEPEVPVTTEPEVEETTVPEVPETTAPEVIDPALTEPETEAPETTAPETPDTAEYVVIYSVSGGKVATTTNQPYNNKDQLVMADATLADGKVTTDAADVLLVTIVNNADNTVSFKTADGKYLHADATNVNLVDSENDDTKFVLEETDGGYFIKLANATFSGKAQYLEYYYEKLTCYGMSTSNPAIYVFQFYPMAETEEEETTEPEVQETTEPEVEETTEAPAAPAVNSADFDTIVTSSANGDSKYTNTYTTTNGWTTVNSAIQTGGATVLNPQFPVIGPDNTHKAVCLNGKVGAAGKLTSPTLTGGISKLTLNYTKMFTDTKLSVTITVTDLATNTSYTHTVAREAASGDKYIVWTDEWTLETPVTGDFTIEVVNNCPSGATGNKDRMTILDLIWEGAQGGAPVVPETTVPEVEETTVPEAPETTTPEVEETTAPETPDTAEYVVIYSVSGGKVATTTNQPYNNKDQLVMADATLADGKVTTDAADVLLVTIVNNADNTVSFKTADGKYLHADATNVNLVDSENDDTKFVLEETDGGYFIKLANATFSGKAQYLEYYYEKLTCYGMSTSNPAIYVFQFYPMAETEEEETTAPEVEETTVPEVEETTVPEAEETFKTITFDNTSKRIVGTTAQQVWVENGITVTNDKAGSSSNVNLNYYNPVRFYKSSTLTIEFPGMTKIVVDSVTYDDNDYAGPLVTAIEALGDSNVTASVADGDVTILFAEPVDSLTVTLSTGQVRAYVMTVYTGESGGTDPEETTVPEVEETTEAPTEAETTEPEVEQTTEAEPAGDNVRTYVFENYKVDGELGGGEFSRDLDADVKFYISSGWFTTQARMYKGAYGQITSQKGIASITFNVGGKDSTFSVWTSEDGETWIKSHDNLAYSASVYNDVTVDFDTPVKYVKLDATNQQIRLASMTVTFADGAEPVVPETTVPEVEETTEAPTEAETTEPEVEETTEAEPAGDVYKKITTAAEFTTGSYVMVVDTGYAPGVVDGTWLSAVQPTIVDGQIVNPNAGVWTLTVDGSTVTMKDSNGVFVAPKGGDGSSNGINKSEYAWTWVFADGTFKFTGTGSDTNVLASNSTTQGLNKFRSYKKSTVTNTTDYHTLFTLYKLV